MRPLFTFTTLLAIICLVCASIALGSDSWWKSDLVGMDDTYGLDRQCISNTTFGGSSAEHEALACGAVRYGVDSGLRDAKSYVHAYIALATANLILTAGHLPEDPSRYYLGVMKAGLAITMLAVGGLVFNIAVDDHTFGGVKASYHTGARWYMAAYFIGLGEVVLHYGGLGMMAGCIGVNRMNYAGLNRM